MSTINWATSYAPAEAERGKFATIDMSTITGYPSTYFNGTCSIPTRGRFALLTYPIGSDSSVVTDTLPNTTIEKTVVLGASASDTTVFNPPIILFELYNNSNNTIYLTHNYTTFNTLTAQGLPIASKSFYSMDRTISTLTIGAILSSEVRMFGHYKS